MSIHHFWAAPMTLAAAYFVGMLVRDIIDASNWFLVSARIALLVFTNLAGEA